MAEPTAAERELAHQIWNDALCNSGVPGWKRDDMLARALADQRARYEAVADAIESYEPEAEDESEDEWINGYMWSSRASVELIRQVSQ